MRLFYLEKRNQVYYVIFKNLETGKKLTAKSTGCQDLNEATYIANKWYYEGIPNNRTKKLEPITDHFVKQRLFNDIESTQFTENELNKLISILKSRNLIKGVIPYKKWNTLSFVDTI